MKKEYLTLVVFLRDVLKLNWYQVWGVFKSMDVHRNGATYQIWYRTAKNDASLVFWHQVK